MYGPNSAVRFQVLNKEFHLITGAENVLAFFKASREVTTIDQTVISMHNAFGSPESSREANSSDNTGVLSQTIPGSDPIAAHNRLFHLMHKTSTDNLTGAGLTDLATRFMANLEEELSTLDVGYDEWTDIPDFNSLVQVTVFTASTKALFGPHLFELSPNIAAEFWEFDSHPNLFKSIPRLFIPKAFRARDKILASIKTWHKFANENCDLNDETQQNVEWEPFFGSKLIRDRQRNFGGIDGYDADALAATDLGLLWA